MDEINSHYNFYKMPDSQETGNQDALPTSYQQAEPKKTAHTAKGVNPQLTSEGETSEAAKSETSSTSEDSTFRRPGFDGYRDRFRELLMATPYQLVVVVLVITDMVLVVGQLMLDLQGAHHTASLSLHYISLMLLSLFFLEILFKMFTYGLEFFTLKFEMFDALVVIVALILDIIYLDATDAYSGLGLIIVLRLWRLVRIQNAMMVQVRRVEEKKLHREQQGRLAVEEELQHCRAYIATLQQRLALNNISYENENRVNSNISLA